MPKEAAIDISPHGDAHLATGAQLAASTYDLEADVPADGARGADVSDHAALRRDGPSQSCHVLVLQGATTTDGWSDHGTDGKQWNTAASRLGCDDHAPLRHTRSTQLGAVLLLRVEAGGSSGRHANVAVGHPAQDSVGVNGTGGRVHAGRPRTSALHLRQSCVPQVNCVVLTCGGHYFRSWTLYSEVTTLC